VHDFPGTNEELLDVAATFAGTLAVARRVPLPDPLSWYPYDILGSLHHLAPLLSDHFEVVADAFRNHPILDIGCADGDIGLLFSSLGCRVTAIDNPPTNSNWMKGVSALKERLSLPLEILKMDVDSQFALPLESYGFTFLLGILYHLKNPYYILETLARHSRFCALSTRVAAETKSGVAIGEEPLVYLLDERESNDDPTNFWTFSPTALARIAKRTGWRIVGQNLVGCANGSNPVDPDKDARMFLLLQSQRLSIPVKIRLLSGWTPVTDYKWAWTLKQFSLDAEILDHSKPTRFFLGFSLVEQLVVDAPLRLSCKVNGTPTEAMEFDAAGAMIFEAKLPAGTDSGKPLHFEFSVEHQYRNAADPRDIGIIMPFSGAIRGVSEPILFWLG
jgi:tRNA (mo5U34)-methyltransferase